jgi:hypothetical protein
VWLVDAVDADSAADELYGGPRADFVAARDRLARQAQQEGAEELAERIRELRKPTTAAWLVNQVVRRHEPDVRRLLDLGEGLRQAYHEMAGDRLRELTRQRHELLQRLGRDARTVARAERVPLSGQVADQVQETFEAALLHPDAAEELRAGRLSGALRVPASAAWPVLEGGANRAAHRSSDAGGTAGRRAGRKRSGRRSLSDILAAAADSEPAASTAQRDDTEPDETEAAKGRSGRPQPVRTHAGERVPEKDEDGATEDGDRAWTGSRRAGRERRVSRRAERARARRQANEAAEARDDAERELSRAEQAAEQAAARVADLRAELDEARQHERELRRDVTAARKALDAADRSAQAAARAAAESD